MLYEKLIRQFLTQYQYDFLDFYQKFFGQLEDLNEKNDFHGLNCQSQNHLI